MHGVFAGSAGEVLPHPPNTGMRVEIDVRSRDPPSATLWARTYPWPARNRVNGRPAKLTMCVW